MKVGQRIETEWQSKAVHSNGTVLIRKAGEWQREVLLGKSEAWQSKGMEQRRLAAERKSNEATRQRSTTKGHGQ